MRRYLAPVVIVAAVAFLAGCGGTKDHNGQDVAFAQAMIPHHRQAVEMADLASSRAASPQVKDLAARIKAAQDPEIRMMQGWLSGWGVKESSKGQDMSGMSGGGIGMMSENDMASLRASAGAAFDGTFLHQMTAHHNGAIDMAKQELAKGKYGPAKSLATSIRDSQQAEVAEMQTILARLGGG